MKVRMRRLYVADNVGFSRACTRAYALTRVSYKNRCNRCNGVTNRRNRCGTAILLLHRQPQMV